MDPTPSTSKQTLDPEKPVSEVKSCDVVELVKRLERAASAPIGEGEDSYQLSRDVAEHGDLLADYYGVPHNKVDSLVSSIKAKAALEQRLSLLDAIDSSLIPPPLPEEILEHIFHMTQDDSDADTEDLEWFSLVCRLWRKPAQRVLFAQNLIFLNQKSIERLRWTLDVRPDLALAVRQLDVANPLTEWTSKEVTLVYRRVAALVRLAKNVKHLRLIHLQTSDNIRHKLWSALNTLDLHYADIQSSTWHSGGGPHHSARLALTDSPEKSALCHALARWNNLRSLTLSGYAHFPSPFSLVCPSHSFPTYQLDYLDLSCMDLPGSSLLWILGGSRSLRRLGLSSTTGITQDTLEALFRIVGGSLEELELSLDRIELVATSPDEEVDSPIFRHLINLQTLIINSDHTFSRDLMEVIATLEVLETISLSIPVLLHAELLAFLETNPLRRLNDLSIDTWDHLGAWTDYERWQISRRCDEKGIELLLNGMHKAPIDLAYYGVGDGLDLSKYWATLEAPPPTPSEPRTRTKRGRRPRSESMGNLAEV